MIPSGLAEKKYEIEGRRKDQERKEQRGKLKIANKRGRRYSKESGIRIRKTNSLLHGMVTMVTEPKLTDKVLQHKSSCHLVIH